MIRVNIYANLGQEDASLVRAPGTMRCAIRSFEVLELLKLTQYACLLIRRASARHSDRVGAVAVLPIGT